MKIKVLKKISDKDKNIKISGKKITLKKLLILKYKTQKR